MTSKKPEGQFARLVKGVEDAMGDKELPSMLATTGATPVLCPLTGFAHSGAHHGEGCKACDEQHEYLMKKHLGVDVRATPEPRTWECTMCLAAGIAPEGAQHPRGMSHGEAMAAKRETADPLPEQARTVTRSEFQADPGATLRRSRKGPVAITDERGVTLMTVYSPREEELPEAMAEAKPKVCEEDGLDDEGERVAPACKRLATHYSCMYFGGARDAPNVCEEHKCRCKHDAPVTASDLPVRYDDVHCKWCGDSHLCGFADREPHGREMGRDEMKWEELSSAAEAYVKSFDGIGTATKEAARLREAARDYGLRSASPPVSASASNLHPKLSDAELEQVWSLVCDGIKLGIPHALTIVAELRERRRASVQSPMTADPNPSDMRRAMRREANVDAMAAVHAVVSDDYIARERREEFLERVAKSLDVGYVAPRSGSARHDADITMLADDNKLLRRVNDRFRRALIGIAGGHGDAKEKAHDALDPKHVEKSAAPSTRYRVGRKVGNTLYLDDTFVGSCITADAAQGIVAATHFALMTPIDVFLAGYDAGKQNIDPNYAFQLLGPPPPLTEAAIEYGKKVAERLDREAADCASPSVIDTIKATPQAELDALTKADMAEAERSSSLEDLREAVKALVWTIERDMLWPQEQTYVSLIKAAVARGKAALAASDTKGVGQ